MKFSVPASRRFCALIVAALLMSVSHRLPAPIREETTPTQTPIPKPKTVPERPKPKIIDNRSTQFDGIWKGTYSKKMGSSVTSTSHNILVMRNGARGASFEGTTTLLTGTFWPDVPIEYSKSPFTLKMRSVSTDLKLDGSNLRIRWEPRQVIDWSPKMLSTAQVEKVKNAAESANEIYTLRGDQLTREFDSNGGVTYTRTK